MGVAERAFRTEVITGHKGTYALVVPFDPAEAWPGLAPRPMSKRDDPRGGRGWPVTGSIAGLPFEGFVGRRYGRSYVVLGPALREMAGLEPGDAVDVTLSPGAPS